MRRLYLVPIIHASSDMGSVGAALYETGAAALGVELWHKHQETVSGFWDSISFFFNHLEVNGFKVYQDGLVADGEEGLKIVNESARQGSVNYRIISSLLQRGATLVKTEDISLVKRELSFVKGMTAKSVVQKEAAVLRYKLAQQSLLKERDNFIARMIGRTLEEGDTGVLFIGAYHDILSRLPGNIEVVQVKNIAKIREYYSALLTKNAGRDILRLAEYLVSPIEYSDTHIKL